jgi:hypothetical protein
MVPIQVSRLGERNDAGPQCCFQPLAVLGAEPGEHLLLQSTGCFVAGLKHRMPA